MKNGDVLDFGLSRIDLYWNTWTPPANCKTIAKDIKDIYRWPSQHACASIPYGGLHAAAARRLGMLCTCCTWPQQGKPSVS